jgi:hypothetical protein
MIKTGAGGQRLELAVTMNIALTEGDLSPDKGEVKDVSIPPRNGPTTARLVGNAGPKPVRHKTVRNWSVEAPESRQNKRRMISFSDGVAVID